MYIPITSQRSCARAWLAAVQGVDAQPHHEAHNVIIDVANLHEESASDRAIVEAVDRFLREHDRWPIETVANTIFPQWTYDRHGVPELFDVYLKSVYPRIKKSHGDWGRYFERMISFPLQRKGESINPLAAIIDKIKRQVVADRVFQNVYELTIYDPIRDAGPVMNRQCLSFLSFKLTDNNPRQLLLTALYRNHYYIERLLGNLIGLGRLMAFVARETGVTVGDLTVVSTHAEIDAVAPRAAIKELVDSCAAFAECEQTRKEGYVPVPPFTTLSGIAPTSSAVGSRTNPIFPTRTQPGHHSSDGGQSQPLS
jgi:thymidylate synthase